MRKWRYKRQVNHIIAGFIGAWLGTELLGFWGPVVGGFHIFPAIFGAIVALLIFFAIACGGTIRRRGCRSYNNCKPSQIDVGCCYFGDI